MKITTKRLANALLFPMGLALFAACTNDSSSTGDETPTFSNVEFPDSLLPTGAEEVTIQHAEYFNEITDPAMDPIEFISGPEDVSFVISGTVDGGDITANDLPPRYDAMSPFVAARPGQVVATWTRPPAVGSRLGPFSLQLVSPGVDGALPRVFEINNATIQFVTIVSETADEIVYKAIYTSGTLSYGVGPEYGDDPLLSASEQRFNLANLTMTYTIAVAPEPEPEPEPEPAP